MGMMIMAVMRAAIVVLLLANTSHCVCSLPAVRTWIHRLVKSLLIVRVSGGARVKNPRRLIYISRKKINSEGTIVST